MFRSISTVFICGALAVNAAAADPDPAQKAAVDAFAQRTVSHKAIYDDAGNVIKLALSNHPAFMKNKAAKPPEGIDDQLFARILQLKHLQAIGLEMQPLSNDGYAMLSQLKELRDVRLHYMNPNAKQSPSPKPADKDAPLFINKLPLPLEVLEIKHCFSIKGGCMEKLKPQPKLRKLEIDTGYAEGSAVEFIKSAPDLENLQIHRTKMSDKDLQQIFAALPKLEILLIRPDGQKNKPDRITGQSLRGLANCPRLRLLILGMDWGDVPYEGGLDALARLRKLEKLNLGGTSVSIRDPAILQLHKLRPDIEIVTKDGSLGGVEGRKTEQEDADWNWDGGVTTHG